MSDPRILIVEDDAERIAWFRRTFAEATKNITGDTLEAIILLGTHEYTHLYLDHDLGTEPRVGRDVARWLIDHPGVQPNLLTIVHSMNVVSADKIVRELADAGRPVLRMPFSVLAATDEVPA